MNHPEPLEVLIAPKNETILFLTDRPPELNPFLALIFKTIEDSGFRLNKIILLDNKFKKFIIFIKNIKSLISIAKQPTKILLLTRPSTLPYVFLLKLYWRVKNIKYKIIYWPFELYGHQISKYSYIIKQLERLFILKNVQILITQNEHRASYYKNLGFKKNLLVIRNYKRQIDILDNCEIELSPTNKKQIVYLGSLIEGRNIENILREIDSFEGYKLVMYYKIKGSKKFLKRHHELIKKMQDTDKLSLFSEISEDAISRTLSKYDVGIITYGNNCLNNYFCEPAKLTEYLSAGLVIISPDFPVFHDLIKTNLFQVFTFTDNLSNFESTLESAFLNVNLSEKLRTIKNSKILSWEEQELTLKKLLGSLLYE